MQLNFIIQDTNQKNKDYDNQSALFFLLRNTIGENSNLTCDVCLKRIFNKETGEIDPAVAEYWKQNYDLRYILDMYQLIYLSNEHIFDY